MPGRASDLTIEHQKVTTRQQQRRCIGTKGRDPLPPAPGKGEDHFLILRPLIQ